VAIRGFVQFVAARFAGSAMVSLDISNLVVIAFPAAMATGNAIVNAVIGSAVAACFAVAFGTMRKRRWVPGAIIVAIVFCASLDPGVASAGMPLMLLRSALLAVAAWAVVRYVLTGSMLAWPVTLFTAAMLEAAVTMATNDRSDLLVNSIVVMTVLAGAILWLVVPRVEEGHA
jgi:hypothetical protein